VARQPSGTGSAEESSDTPLDDLDSTAAHEDEDIEDDADDETEAVRSAESDALWADVRMQPVEIALSAGVGYTLRAYRLSTEVREPVVGDRDDDFTAARSARAGDDEGVEFDEDELPEIDEDELTAQALAAPAEDGRHRADDEDDAEPADDETDADEEPLEAATEPDADGADAAAEAEEEPEEVPVFLAENGRLLLFRTPEGLVEYVRGSGDHELAQLDTWAELRERLEPEDVVPLAEDQYELDLVVENLRGGHDVWDPALIIQAGEIARDIGHALRVNSVIASLAPGSPLDDLDEGLRAVEAGGFGSFLARRKLRKIDAQTTAALGWRTVVGKISAIVDWRN